MKLSAIILAAGNSSRMGSPKALLEYEGLSFIETVCRAIRSSGAAERVAVLGGDAAVITAGWKPSGEKVVVNPDPDLGQISSVRVGLSACDNGAEGYMICLVDQPTIAPATYKAVVDFWSSHKDCIVIPRCLRPSRPSSGVPGFKRGHPIIIPAAYRSLCFEGPAEKGLHWVTHHPSVKVLDLDVSDAGILRDFDTPEDYEGLNPAGNKG